MTTDNNVTYLKQLSNDDAMRYIREIARDSSRVFLRPHAKDQMLARHFTRKQVIDSFESCRFFEEPHWSLAHGNWQMTVEAPSMDDWIRVALSLNNKTDDDGESNFIMVITVIRVEG